MTYRASFTVGKLRALLKDLPDDMPVVEEASDHSYAISAARVEGAVVEEGDHLSEDYPSSQPLPEGAERIKVFLVGRR